MMIGFRALGPAGGAPSDREKKCVWGRILEEGECGGAVDYDS